MDEYIKREDAINALCVGCNDRFSDEPCEPPDCEMRNAINSIRAADVVEVVRCKDCKYATELDRHCDINGSAYRHCGLWRGEETKNVWHKYKKYYKDYSIIERDGFCSDGERRKEQ